MIRWGRKDKELKKKGKGKKGVYMSNSTAAAQSPTSKTNMTAYVGCLLMAVSIAAFGLSLANIQGPVLESLGGMESFSLVTSLTSASLCLMTPVGGSLMDIIGTKKLVLWFGLINVVCGILLAFASSLPFYLILRVILSACQGAIAAVPFIAVRQIFPASESPKYIGYVSAAFAIGSFMGSWLAGLLLDHGMIGLASAFPVIFLAPGIYLIYKDIPESELHPDNKMDYIGIVLLALSLFSLVFWLNYGPIYGWMSWFELLCMGLFIVSLIALIYAEKKVASPLIPLNLFKNKIFLLVLIITGLCVVYTTAITAYVPQAVQQLMGQPASVSGTIQIPRVILSIVTPGLAGAWVARRYSNYWKAFALSALFIAVPMSFLVFIGPHMPVWFVFVMLAFTGIADSLRTVSSIPAAQLVLERKDLGIGTALVGFIISLSGVLASTLFSIAYNDLTTQVPGTVGLTNGIDTILLISAAAGVIALLLAVFVFRPTFAKVFGNKNEQK